MLIERWITTVGASAHLLDNRGDYPMTLPAQPKARTASSIVVAGPEIFLGKWRIVEMEKWDRTYLDLLGQAHITFGPLEDGDHAESGTFAFGTVNGWLDCRYSLRDGKAVAEFSWEGRSDRDDAFGRGWVILEKDNVSDP
jgi:hypothetical protein